MIKHVRNKVKADGHLMVSGVGWDNNADTIQVESIAKFAKDLPKTKRSVLTSSAKHSIRWGYLTVLTCLRYFFSSFAYRNANGTMNWMSKIRAQMIPCLIQISKSMTYVFT